MFGAQPQPPANADFPVRAHTRVRAPQAAGGAAAIPASPLTLLSAQVVSPPTDGISALCWSPARAGSTSSFLVATSWDQQTRCYEVQANGQSAPRAAFTSDAPVLCAAWHHDGASVFSGGCDKQVKRWDLGSNAQSQVAAHDAPVRHLAWIPELSMLVTGGWDRQLRYWDLRQQAPAFSHTLPERCYSLSVTHPLLVVATADRHIQVFNLANPQVVTYYKAAAEIANSAPPAALAAATLHLGSVSGATHPGCQRRSPPSLRTSRRA